MKKLRAVTESEVIAEFLRNEFHHHDYDRDRGEFAWFVESPDLTDERENAIRRALFYRRRGHMWNQLPSNTKWWEVRLEPSDLDRLSVFARTHWRKIGGGECRLSHVVERMRTRDFSRTFVVGGTAHGGVEVSRVGDVVNAVKGFSKNLTQRTDNSAAVLIGIDDLRPVTILEGNHRFAAALLAGPEVLFRQFRVFFGASRSMAKCCWYGEPKVANMARYARNRLQHFGNPEADLERLLPSLYPEPRPSKDKSHRQSTDPFQAVK